MKYNISRQNIWNLCVDSYNTINAFDYYETMHNIPLDADPLEYFIRDGIQDAIECQNQER
jgi:hypothetical protein